MEKHTKEYAEKLAENNAFLEEKPFVQGYMKAIEETNVAGLLEALKLAKSRLHSLGFDNTSNTILKIDAAIKKAE